MPCACLISVCDGEDASLLIQEHFFILWPVKKKKEKHFTGQFMHMPLVLVCG